MDVRKTGLNGRVIPQIRVHEFVEFGAVNAGSILARAAADGQDLLYLGVAEAFAEDALSDQAGGSEN